MHNRCRFFDSVRERSPSWLHLKGYKSPTDDVEFGQSMYADVRSGRWRRDDQFRQSPRYVGGEICTNLPLRHITPLLKAFIEDGLTTLRLLLFGPEFGDNDQLPGQIVDALDYIENTISCVRQKLIVIE